jgi:DNA-directed RNA polymerase subunit RPC12/RpoP
MREKFRRFMIGRYGNDALNQFLSISSIACLFIALVSRWRVFYWAGLALLIYSYFRVFSRNIPKRTAENYKFYTLKENVCAWARGRHAQWNNRKIYRYYTCPKCHQKLRVPRGRGRLQISCPRCSTQFIRKT